MNSFNLSLFLFGTNSIRPKDLTEKELIRKTTEKNNESGKIEMNRLRTTAQVSLQLLQGINITKALWRICFVSSRY